MLQKLRDYCAREDIRARLMIGIFSLIVLVYAMFTIFGHSMPSVRVADHFQKGENPIPPLLWIFCASLIHLMSIGVQLGWFSAGQG